jgi:hypothetical protein
MAVTDFQQKNDAVVDITAAALHSLANGGFATLAEYDASAAGELNFVCDIELFLDTSVNPTDGNLCDLYFLMALDGTNYTATGGPPSNLYAGSWRIHSTADQLYTIRDVILPACKIKGYFRNGCGQTTSASGSYVKIYPRRQQGTT